MKQKRFRYQLTEKTFQIEGFLEDEFKGFYNQQEKYLNLSSEELTK